MARRLSLKISVAGVRGIVGESLTPQLVTSYAAAFGTYCGAGPVLIGSDTRPSREMVKHAAIAGLLSVGCTPVDVGIVPVPALQFHVRKTGAFGAICISASHNPIEWNALKFIGPDGIVLRPNQSEELTDLYHQGFYPRVTAAEIAETRLDHTVLSAHREAVIALIDAEHVRRRGFRIVADCTNGAASLAMPEFLRALGCEVIELNTDMDEPFPRNPEPLPENIGGLCTLVRESGADMGIALDADADRLALVNELGEPLGEDCTIALAARHYLKRRKSPIVVNVSTSRIVDDVAAEQGCAVYRTRVGEIHVVKRMIEVGAEIGGEHNGGVILREVNPCRDSFVGMALLLESLAEEGRTLSELRGLLPHYATVKAKVECLPREVAPYLRALQQLFAGEQMDTTDGLTVLWPDRWLQARPSNTEPVLRITAEAPTEHEAEVLVREALDCIKPTL